MLPFTKGARGNMAAKGMEKYGHWLFLLGVVLAVVLGFAMPNATWAMGLLALLGLIVGLVNITATEVKDFLIAAIALIVAAGSFALIPMVGTYIADIMKYLLAMVSPAATIVALVQIWKLAKSK
jgi:ABC-type Mn2+/Zn2+ transport system permease subunit